MSRRNQLNVKDSVRAREESIDRQLKDAGLWEEGLSFDLKKQYVDMIKASENTAKEEETKRRGTYVIEEEEYQNCLIPRSITIDRRSQPNQEDSEPVITYESMSTVSRRRVLSPSVHNKETVKRSCQTKVSSTTQIEHSPFNFSSLSKTPESSKTFKKINSLLSNKSITIKYSISPEKEKIPENIAVSESDDECEETDPLALNEEIPEKSVDSSDIANEESVVSKQLSTDDCPNLHSSGEISFVDEDATPGSNSDSPMFSLNFSAVKKAIAQSKSTQNSIKSPLGSTEIEEKLSKIDAASPDIFDYASSLEPIKVNEHPGDAKTVEVKVKSPEEDKIVDILNENLKDDVPLTRKFNLNREKSNLAYLKSSYETETKCVKRIYSLITDWQLALAKYQRSLANPCKWGLPVSMDRQVKIGLLKKSYFNQKLRPTPQAPDLSDTSDASSDSEKLVFDDSDEDFEVFMKKGRKPAKSTRNGNRRKGKLKINLPSSKETKEQTVEMSNENDKKEYSEPPCVSETNKCKTPEDEEETNSQSLLDDLPVTVEEPTELAPSNKIPVKHIRKSFDLFSNGGDTEAPTNTKSRSPKLFESQSDMVPEVQSQNTSNENQKPSKSEENNLPSLTEDGEAETIIRRSNVKRKASSTFCIPPKKKAALSDAEKEDDIVMECEINSTSVRLKDLLSKNRNKESRSSLPEKLNPLDNSTKHDSKSGSILKAALTECKNIPEHQPRPTPATHSPPLLPDMVTGDGSGAGAPVREKVNFIECPICLSMFSIRDIELHASECNGVI